MAQLPSQSANHDRCKFMNEGEALNSSSSLNGDTFSCSFWRIFFFAFGVGMHVLFIRGTKLLSLFIYPSLCGETLVDLVSYHSSLNCIFLTFFLFRYF